MTTQLSALHGLGKIHRKLLMKQPALITRQAHIMGHSWRLGLVTKAFGYENIIDIKKSRII